MGRRQQFRRWASAATATTAVLLTLLLVPSCGNTPGPLRARLDGVVPPLADVKWVPQYPLGDEPSVFNEPPLRGKVVVLDFYASW